MAPGNSPTFLHNLRPEDAPGLLALNNAHVAETSELDESSLATLLAEAFYARGVDHGATALLIAFDQNAAYESPNFLWFKAARDSFIYVDRILVASATRGQGIARRLYEDLFAAARRAGHDRIVCEVNIVPPNPASEAFHQAMGFEPVGQAAIYGGAKTVRYFEKILR